MTGECFHLFVGITDLIAVVLDRSRQVPGQDFRTVVKQRNGGGKLRITGDLKHIAPNDTERVGQNSDHMAVFLNVFRKRVAHQAPSPDVAHTGKIGKKMIIHKV